MQSEVYDQKKNIFEAYVDEYFKTLPDSPHPHITHLIESMKYSATAGGKRFRPVLSLLTADLLGIENNKALPFALAVEMIHTYSLIHDDLPCMDDDDERRGKPTNHKVYGEDVALIAGDALLTEAFAVLAGNYQSSALVRELSTAAGWQGMVGGQAIDLRAQEDGTNENELKLLHELKTGALISVAVRGVARAAEVPNEEYTRLKTFGENLGLAFQVADDILDYDPNNLEKGNFATLIGLEKTKGYLQELTEASREALSHWPETNQELLAIVEYNATRVI